MTRNRLPLFSATLLLLTGVFAVMMGTDLSALGDLTSYIFLVPLVSLYFLIVERKTIFADAVYSFAISAGILAGAALILVLGLLSVGEMRISILVLSLVVAWWALFVLFFGKRCAVRALFPLGFLILSVPLPSAIVIPVEEVLKVCSAWCAWALFGIARIPLIRDGTTFHLTNLSIEVAPQCSGINSAISLVITALVAGKMFLRTGSRRVALVLLALPIACFKNGCRIFTLSVIGNYATIDVLHGPLHKQGGKPFFVLALVFLGIALWLLGRTEKKRGSAHGTQHTTDNAQVRGQETW